MKPSMPMGNGAHMMLNGNHQQLMNAMKGANFNPGGGGGGNGKKPGGGGGGPVPVQIQGMVGGNGNGGKKEGGGG
ncbi:hypothetical protein L195_g063782, partial [Trifolium pratense]